MSSVDHAPTRASSTLWLADREGIAASDGDGGIDLTAEEVDAWAETGVLPDRAEHWFARHGF